MSSVSRPGRPLRADAQRNRDALVAAAREMFLTYGPDVPMVEIAEAAGVGNGTLYRHFPERDSLIAAVYHEGLKTVCDQADRLLAEHPADRAIELWLLHFVDYVRANLPAKRIVMQRPELADWSPADPLPPAYAGIETLLGSTMFRLLAAAAEQGLVGAQAEPRDLLRLASAICQINAGDQEATRMVRLIVDGLRHRQESDPAKRVALPG